MQPVLRQLLDLRRRPTRRRPPNPAARRRDRGPPSRRARRPGGTRRRGPAAGPSPSGGWTRAITKVGEVTAPRTPRPSPRPRVRVVLPAPSSPVSRTRSPGRSSAASRRPRSRICSGDRRSTGDDGRPASPPRCAAVRRGSSEPSGLAMRPGCGGRPRLVYEQEASRGHVSRRRRHHDPRASSSVSRPLTSLRVLQHHQVPGVRHDHQLGLGQQLGDRLAVRARASPGPCRPPAPAPAAPSKCGSAAALSWSLKAG